MSYHLAPRLAGVAALLTGAFNLAAQPLAVTLHPDHIACFGEKSGSITADPSGGVPPYKMIWSNGDTTQYITTLGPGYYHVDVMDAAHTAVRAEVTLTEPEELKVLPQLSSYPNGHNISCFECSNGTIQLQTSRGTPPYAFEWVGESSTAQNRYGLGPGTFKYQVTDANGCVAGAILLLTQPERSDWTMSGNAGTDPDIHYIGTNDNKEVVFKANGQEVLRLLPDGAMKIFGSAAGEGPLYRDADGTMRLGGPLGDVLPPLPPTQCANGLVGSPYWQVGGNLFSMPLCDGVQAIPRLGTRQAFPLHLITNDQTRMQISEVGNVGIGLAPPANGSIYKLYVDGGIATRDVKVTAGDWPDYVFADGYRLMPLPELRAFVKQNNHLPGIPSATEVERNEGVEVGDMQRRMLEVMEQQALYILQLEERIQVLEERRN